MPIPHLRSIVTFVMMLFFFVNAFYLPVGSTMKLFKNSQIAYELIKSSNSSPFFSSIARLFTCLCRQAGSKKRLELNNFL